MPSSPVSPAANAQYLAAAAIERLVADLAVAAGRPGMTAAYAGQLMANAAALSRVAAILRPASPLHAAARQELASELRFRARLRRRTNGSPSPSDVARADTYDALATMLGG